MSLASQILKEINEASGILGSIPNMPGGSITSIGPTSSTIGGILDQTPGNKQTKDAQLLVKYMLVIALKLQTLLKKMKEKE